MCPHHPFPKSQGNPKSVNKLTINEPATILAFIFSMTLLMKLHAELQIDVDQVKL